MSKPSPSNGDSFMRLRRFPRKAKKWAKKNAVRLSFVKGKRIWYYIDSQPFMLKGHR